MTAPQTDITLHAHPPERRRPRSVVAASGCCCCCCCCLHTLGGLVGAAVASRDNPAAGTYWLMNLVVIALTLVGAAIFGGGPLGANLTVGLFILLLAGPAVQLGASVLAAAAVPFTGPSGHHGAMLRGLGKITGVALGTALVLLFLMYGFALTVCK